MQATYDLKIAEKQSAKQIEGRCARAGPQLPDPAATRDQRRSADKRMADVRVAFPPFSPMPQPAAENKRSGHVSSTLVHQASNSQVRHLQEVVMLTTDQKEAISSGLASRFRLRGRAAPTGNFSRLRADGR